MKSLVLHGKNSSPEKIQWLIKPLLQFGDVEAPPFEYEVKEGIERAMKYDFDLVAGHSRGGLIALIVGALKGKSVIAVSAPTDRRKQREYLSKFPEGAVQHSIYKDLLKLPEEEFDYYPLKYANMIRKALLIHGEKDEIVLKDHSVLMCEEIKKYGGDCELHIIPGMRHSPIGQQYSLIWDVITKWVKEKVLSS